MFSLFISNHHSNHFISRVYVIHFMHLADDFLHSATSLPEKPPAFVQSLHKMKAHSLNVKAGIPIDLIGDYRFSLGRV